MTFEFNPNATVSLKSPASTLFFVNPNASQFIYLTPHAVGQIVIIPVGSTSIKSPNANLVANPVPQSILNKLLGPLISLLGYLVPSSYLTVRATPHSIIDFDYPLVSQFIKQPYPQGLLSFLFPTSSLETSPIPVAEIEYLVPFSNLVKLAVPIGFFTQVFFTPVLALDNGFLWLDDGGRMKIDY